MKRLVLASALALLALRGGAAAQPAPAAPSVNAKAARDHFKAGERLIKQQKFPEAISELEQAYKLDPQTEHLYNLGVAHHLGGDDSIAIEYYRLYLLDAPAGTTARAAAGYLSSLEKKLVDARDKKIRQDLADAQARAAQAGSTQDSVELLLYAQYIADAEAKERKVQVLDDEIQANEAEIKAQDQRRTVELAKAQRATEQAKKWENHARKAPSGGGRKRRITGLILLGAGAAGVTMGAHEYYSRTSSPENLAIANHSSIYAIAGGTSLLLGLVFMLAGENASKAPRPDSTFRDIQLLPAVGREGGGLSLTARF